MLEDMCTEARPGGLVMEVGHSVREAEGTVTGAQVEKEELKVKLRVGGENSKEEELEVELGVGGEDSRVLSLVQSLGRG